MLRRSLVLATVLTLQACTNVPALRPCPTPAASPAAPTATPIAKALLDQALRRVLTGTTDQVLVDPHAEDAIAQAYFWWLVVPRTTPAHDASRYNVAFAEDIAESFPDGTRVLATTLAMTPRDGATLMATYRAHARWLFRTLDRDRFVGLGFQALVDDLLAVRAHMLTLQDHDERMEAISRALRMHARTEELPRVPYPPQLNAHRAELYGALFTQRFATAPSTAAGRRALLLHSFWYRRYLEHNACEVQAILEAVAAHYR